MNFASRESPRYANVQLGGLRDDGAISVMVEGAGEIRVDAGCAAIVPRGAWHRLAVHEPGRLLFVNSRMQMQSRPARAPT